MFKIIAIVIVSVRFLFDFGLHVLEYKSRNRGIPEELSDVYDETTYLKWKRYAAEKLLVSMIKDAVSFLFLLTLLSSPLLSLAAMRIENPYTSAIVVLSIALGGDILLSMPFDYVRDIKIETKYGFNLSSVGTFVADQIKQIVISMGLVMGLTCLLVLIHQSLGDYTILLFSGILFGLVLAISFFYPFFSKIYNKFASLEEGELRDALIKMLESHHYHVRDIKVMDASRRTTKSNAYFTGFGKSKTIVLYDNLLRSMTKEQILAIFAHEMGHGLHKDTLKNSLVSLGQIVLIVVLAWLLLKFPEIYQDFGFSRVDYGLMIVLLVSVLLPVVVTLVGLFQHAIARKAEFRADRQAVDEGYGDDLVSALKTLFREDLGDLNPHPLVVKLTYTHPTLLERVRHIEQYQKERPAPTKESE